jgi:hypothetical protein
MFDLLVRILLKMHKAVSGRRVITRNCNSFGFVKCFFYKKNWNLGLEIKQYNDL